jgi:CAS/CSE protein involved in chromosome segregation
MPLFDSFRFLGAMRVIVTARQTLTPVYEQTLSRLVAILGVISKNPSNPNFDQYIFESISGLMRFVQSCSI